MKYYVTDVFSNGKYSGNQLAIFILEKEISTELMQHIAQEVNYSETTFIDPVKEKDDSYNVRVFTPQSEIGFAGHPTLGTAFVLKKFIKKRSKNSLKLNFKVGQINVTVLNEIYWMKQMQPVFSKAIDVKTIASLLNLDICNIDTDYPIEGVTTGLPFTIVPLRTKDALKKATINTELYNEFIKEYWSKGILVCCRGGYSALQNMSARVFVPWLGIAEDPATGSAAGCLGAWLLKNNYFKTPFVDICIAQGYEINRPSEINVQVSLEDKTYDINVGGEVQLIAEGNWFD